MKRFIALFTIWAVAGVLFPAAAPAQEQLKIGTIHQVKVFDNYYKTKLADAQLKENAARKDEEKTAMLDRLKKGDEEYQKLLESSNDQAVSVEEREKRKKAAEAKLVELQQLQQRIQSFDRAARAELGEEETRKRENILEEIRKVIDRQARAGNYDLILDTSSMGTSRTPMVLYTSGKNDLTEAILKELNSTAPPALQTEGNK